MVLELVQLPVHGLECPRRGLKEAIQRVVPRVVHYRHEKQ